MSALLIKVSSALFVVSVIGALIGIAMAMLLAPTPAAPQDEQEEDQRSQRGRY
ncbi:hypothetical protein LMG6871_02864 [Ralstonia edaphis]|uniref:hypothetical protein n=1 Tax=Ralstonia edaphi TaxID=3058599 RepID=UPI0028F60885|nr:hypothetical protein [Ralstonia sp. LMG 6871]CAJ0719438.1 hypothetical protein LMG6871_02864 [Ralstonia sp. LMG 6871]